MIIVETVFILLYRTVLFYSLLMLSLRIMGKRQLGETEPSDLVVTILLSELAASPLQNIEEPIYRSIVPIAVLIVIELLIALVSLKNVNLRRFFQGKYSVLIADGKINQGEMKKAHVTVEEVLEEIRQNGGIGIDEVRYCILETSGRMSVIMKSDIPPVPIPVSIILDGKIINKNLASCDLTKQEIISLLKEKKIDKKDVFWMYYAEGEVKTVLKDGK